MLQTHAAISTSLTGNRSSYWNLKPTLQPPRVRPYSIAPVQKKWYSTGPCANRSSQPQAHEEEGSTVLLLSKRFSTSAAIRRLPGIYTHIRGRLKRLLDLRGQENELQIQTIQSSVGFYLWYYPPRLMQFRKGSGNILWIIHNYSFACCFTCASLIALSS